MKKILLLMMCCPVMLAAQNGNGVTVSNLAVNAGMVTFNVSWNNEHPEGFLWSDSVWVFVDYNKNGVMTRLPVTSATATAGTVEKISGNDTGVRVIGNARSAGSFSATVQLLTDITDVAGACAYASNYPPVGEYIDATHISFIGTPMYKILLEETGGSGTLTDYSDGSYTLRPGYTIKSFNDKTGAPGSFCSVYVTIPTYAASTQTWTLSGTAGTQTWSAGIIVPTCLTATPIDSDTNPSCRAGASSSAIYNWPYVVQYASILCPNPWRVPTSEDLCLLEKILFNRSTCVLDCQASYSRESANPYTEARGFARTLYGSATGLTTNGWTFMWTTTSCSDDKAVMLKYWQSTDSQPKWTSSMRLFSSVRCIR